MVSEVVASIGSFPCQIPASSVAAAAGAPAIAPALTKSSEANAVILIHLFMITPRRLLDVS